MVKIKKLLSEIWNSIKKDASIQKHRWYVWMALVASIFTILTVILALNIKKDISALKYDYPIVYNEQNVNTSRIEWWELINSYYRYLNEWDFENACSLISTRNCSMYDQKLFTQRVKDKRRKYFTEYEDWITLSEVKYSGITTENTKQEIRCVKEQFKNSGEKDYIYQIQQYYILPRPDGWKEIWKIFCEKIFKDNFWDITKNISSCWLEENKCYWKIFDR